MGSWLDDMAEAGHYRNESIPLTNFCPMFNRVVETGLSGHIKEAQERIRASIDNLDHNVDKLHFWQAAIMTCQSAITLARRFAQAAREMAAKEEDPVQRAELEEIARICEWVPEKPARTFREGLQSFLLVCLALSLENRAPLTAWGRMDQYLYLLFKRDLAEGRLTLEEVADLLAEFYTHCVRLEWMIPPGSQQSDFIQKGIFSSIGLSGTDEKGEDASNEFTYLLLHVMGLLRYPEPHLMLGWHKGVPDWLMRKAMETNWKAGGGVPHFQNCDHFVDLMVRRGVSLVDARNWVSTGCSQILPADQYTNLVDLYPNIALCVDLALHNGWRPRRGSEWARRLETLAPSRPFKNSTRHSKSKRSTC